MTVLLSALSLAGNALQPVAEPAIKDGYAGLKALLVRRFGTSNPKLEGTLNDYAEDPETYAKPATKVLREAGADRDQEVLDLATKLLERAKASSTSINVSSIGAGSVAIGGSVSGSSITTNTTNDAPRERG